MLALTSSKQAGFLIKIYRGEGASPLRRAPIFADKFEASGFFETQCSGAIEAKLAKAPKAITLCGRDKLKTSTQTSHKMQTGTLLSTYHQTSATSQ